MWPTQIGTPARVLLLKPNSSGWLIVISTIPLIGEILLIVPMGVGGRARRRR